MTTKQLPKRNVSSHLDHRENYCYDRPTFTIHQNIFVTFKWSTSLRTSGKTLFWTSSLSKSILRGHTEQWKPFCKSAKKRGLTEIWVCWNTGAGLPGCCRGAKVGQQIHLQTYLPRILWTMKKEKHSTFCGHEVRHIWHWSFLSWPGWPGPSVSEPDPDVCGSAWLPVEQREHTLLSKKRHK